MADETFEYDLSLVDHMSGPSKVASESMANLARSLTDAKEKLGFYNQQLLLAKKNQDAGAYTKYSALIGDETKRYAMLHEAVGGLSNAKKILASHDAAAADTARRAAMAAAALATQHKNAAAAISAQQKSAAEAMAQQIEASAGALAAGLAMASKFAVAAIGAIYAAGAAAIGILAALAYEGAKFAIAMTQGQTAAVTMYDALGQGVSTGREVDDMLDGLSRQLGMTKESMEPLTRSFMAMGITGTDALHNVVLAAESARAIMKDPAAANAFETLTRKIQGAAESGEGLKIPLKGLGSLAETGANVNDVAKKMGMSSHMLAEQLKNGTVNANKFGDALQAALIEKGARPLQRLAMSAENLKGMLGQFFSEMFEDMDDAIEPFLAAVKSLFSIFDSKSKPSGGAMKAAIGGAFSFIFKTATPVIFMLKHFFLEVVLWSINAYIFIKKHWTEIGTIFDGLKVITVALIVPLAIMGGIVAASAASMFALGAGILWVIGKFSELKGGAVEAGKSIATGLVDGMTGGMASVMSTAWDLGKAAIDGIKKALDAHSPSRKMFEIGAFSATGVKMGLHAGVGGVQKAAAHVGDAVMMGTGKGLSSRDYSATLGRIGAPQMPAAGGGGTRTGNITINLEAPNGVTNVLELTEVAVATLFERLSLQQGT